MWYSPLGGTQPGDAFDTVNDRLEVANSNTQPGGARVTRAPCLSCAAVLLSVQGLAIGFVLLRVEGLVEEGKL